MMNRFIANTSLLKKFCLLGTAVLLLVCFLSWQSMSQLRSQLSSTHNELKGLTAEDKLGALITATQLHRGIGMIVLNGDVTLQPQWEAKRSEINTLWQQLYPTLDDQWTGSHAMAKQLNQQWQALANQAPTLSPEENFKKHVALVDQLISMMRMVADDSELTLDPVLSTYYLMSNYCFDVPALHELIARLRGSATSAIASKQLNLPTLMPAMLVHTQTQQKMQAVLFAFDRVQAGGFQLPADIAHNNRALSSQLEQLGRQLQALSNNTLSIEPKAFFDQATEPLQVAQRLEKASGQFLSGLLEQRVADVTRSLWITGVGTLLVIMLTVACASVIFVDLNTRIRHLLAQTKIIASGDLRQPVNTQAKDEIGRIAAEIKAVRSSQGKVAEV